MNPPETSETKTKILENPEPSKAGNVSTQIARQRTSTNFGTWRNLETEPPPLLDFGEAVRTKPYALAVDGKGRMSVGYPYRYSTGEVGWVFAKPIGQPTHWMPLPPPPCDPVIDCRDITPEQVEADVARISQEWEDCQRLTAEDYAVTINAK